MPSITSLSTFYSQVSPKPSDRMVYYRGVRENTTAPDDPFHRGTMSEGIVFR